MSANPKRMSVSSPVGGGAMAYTTGTNITTINAREDAIRVGLTPLTADQSITIRAGDYSLGVQAGYLAPTPDTLRLDWQERDPSYGAGANTFLGSQLWTGDEALPYTRIPMRGGRHNLPRNWQIVGQTENATQIRPYLDASHMSVDDPAVAAARQATGGAAPAQRPRPDRQSGLDWRPPGRKPPTLVL